MAISGYLIEKYNNMGNAYTCKRLVEEASNAGIELKIIGVHDSFVCEDGIYNQGQKLEKRDFVINRYKWGRLKDSINKLADKSYNDINVYNVYINKFEQVSRLHSDAFLIPKYVLGKSSIPYEKLAEMLSVPFVAKGLESSMGEEILLIDSIEEYKRLVSYGQEKEWLFEEFIKESFGRDIRFYSIRGEVAACMTRKSQGDFRANVALGADVEAYEIDDNIRRAAKDIYDETGLDFLGIDLLFGKELPFFCEINVMPGLEGIEKASGKNVAYEIISTIKKDFSHE